MTSLAQRSQVTGMDAVADQHCVLAVCDLVAVHCFRNKGFGVRQHNAGRIQAVRDSARVVEQLHVVLTHECCAVALSSPRFVGLLLVFCCLVPDRNFAAGGQGLQ